MSSEDKESRCNEFSGMVITVLHSGLSGIFCWAGNPRCVLGMVTNMLVSGSLDPSSKVVIGVVNQATTRSC